MTPTGSSPRAVLTIAGSDSGGGAGIQADLKTFTRLGVWGTCAVTCVTAQNPMGVSGIAAIAPDMVVRQMRAVGEAYDVRAAKTGMLFSAPIVEAVADTLAQMSIPALVVDPVMVATSGARLLEQDAIDALCSRILPLASVVTPNRPEAEVLLGRAIVGADGVRDAAHELAGRYATGFIIKGGHGTGAHAVDVLCHEGTVTELSAPRIPDVNAHGTGCTYAAAMAALLAGDASLVDAARQAQAVVGEKLRIESGGGTE